MPVAMPTWRKVLDDPVDIPLRSGGTTDTVAEATTGLVIPTPMPATMNPGSRTVQVESAWTPGHQVAAEGHQQQAEAEQEAGLDPHGELAGERGDHEGQDGDGKEPQPGGEGAVPEHLLEVQREVEEHGEDRGRERERGE